MIGKWNPALQPLLVPIETLVEDPDNANTHGEENLTVIRNSLETYGQQKPIVVAGNTVKAGNGTVSQALVLGWTHIAAVPFDGDEYAAEAYALVDNRAGSLSKLDPAVVGRKTRWLSQEWPEWKPETVGYDAGSLAKLPEWKITAVEYTAKDIPVVDPQAEWAKTQREAATAMIATAAGMLKEVVEPSPEPAAERFAVVVECDDADALDELVTALLGGGYRCRRL